MNYNYLEAMVEDITEWMYNNNFNLNDYESFDEAREYLNDLFWDDDDIIGNGPLGYGTKGDYESYLCHNWDAFFEAIENLYVDMNDIIEIFEKGDSTEFLKYCDTLIRLNTLDMAIETALEDWGNKENKKDNV